MAQCLWTRTIGPTVVDHAVDTTLVSLLAFLGTYSAQKLVSIIVMSYLLKKHL